MVQKAEIISFERLQEFRSAKAQGADARKLGAPQAEPQEEISPLDIDPGVELVLTEKYPGPTDPEAIARSVFGTGLEYEFIPVARKTDSSKTGHAKIRALRQK